MNKTITTTLLIAFSATFTSLPAQDRHFAWTYESTTMPKGAIDLEPQVTFSTGREYFYNRYKTRLEFETGLTNKLQTSLYLNAEHVTSAITDSTDNVTGMGKKSIYSFSNEWKLNLLNPSISPFGLGLYVEYGIAPDELELEFKILFDKKTPKSIFAYNLVSELESEYEFINKGKGKIEAEKELVVENDLAYMYMINPGFGVGLEARNHNEIVKGEWEHSALFAGPTIFFTQKNFFAIINALPQIMNLKGGGLELDEDEKFSGRILLGISL